jgi:tRNA A37 threonylcarbamoyltransferase TsaD
MAGLQAMEAENSMFEPLKFGSMSRQIALVTGGLSANLRLVDDVRTAVKESEVKISYPKINLAPA